MIWDRPTHRKTVIEAIDDAWANRDCEAMKRVFADLTLEQKLDVWGVFREFSKKRREIKKMLSDEAQSKQAGNS